MYKAITCLTCITVEASSIPDSTNKAPNKFSGNRESRENRELPNSIPRVTYSKERCGVSGKVCNPNSSTKDGSALAIMPCVRNRWL